MKRQGKLISPVTWKSQKGMTFIETMIALAILLIVATGVMGTAAIALTTTENQGHLAARTAEYAQDKMEQLLALQFPDTLTDTTVFPSAITGNGFGLTPGGSMDPSAPVAGYSDYVDASGAPVGAGGNWQYIRVWQVVSPVTVNGAANANLKQITVTVQVRREVAAQGLLPKSSVTALKSSPF